MKTETLDNASIEEDKTYMFPKLDWMRRTSSTAFVICEGLRWREDGRWTIPDFQRPLVWTTEQKVSFVESLIQSLPVGEYCIHKCGWNNKTQREDYEVLDGQQRWSAIFGYVDNEFPVFGLYWNDLNRRTKLAFEGIVFPVRFVEGLTYAQKLDAYNRLAYGGTAHEVKPVEPSEDYKTAYRNGYADGYDDAYTSIGTSRRTNEREKY